MENNKKSVEQVFREVVMSLTSEQQKTLIGILRCMNSPNVAAAVTLTPADGTSTDADQVQLVAMQSYIDRTPMLNRGNYQLLRKETIALYNEAQHDQVKALFMAFNYGMAKGYRAGQSVKMPARRW